MATTFVDYTGDGNATKQFTFPSYKVEDIKVEVDNVVKTVSTHYNITSYTTTGGGNVVFTSGNIPVSPAAIRIFRDTDVDSAKATYQAGSSVKAGDLNNNHTQLLYAAQEEQNQTVITSRIKDAAVTTDKIKGDNITGALIADDQIDSEHYAADSIDSEHYAPGSVDTAAIGASQVTTNELASDAVTTIKITDLNVTTAKIANDAINGTKIADNSINSEHYVDGSIDTEHIADGAVNASKLASGSITVNQLANNSVLTAQVQDGQITSAKLHADAVITSSEQGSATTNDTSFLTSAAADARFFNISSGDTIKDGDSFPDNDTTIATTAAINDRIIDIVNDVGGFDIIASEQHFPNTNPQGAAGTAAVLSVKAASTTLTPSGTTLTITNGNLADNADITITGVTAAIPSGFGFLVESTGTLHTYTFHRLVPKATEVTTVAGISGNVTTVAGISANTTTVAGISSDVTTVAGIASNVTSVAGNTSNINSAVSNATNINSAVSNASNINTVAGSISNVNTTAGSIASVNTAAANLNSIANFGDQYQVASSNPSTDGGGNALAEGDLYFNTTADELKVYDGSAWVSGVTQTGNFALTTGNSFTADNTYVDNAKARFGTGQDLEIFHNASDSIINDTGTGNLKVQTGGSTKLEIQSGGVDITGNITISGNVDGRDVAADGSSLDNFEAGNVTTNVTNGNIKLTPDGTGVAEVRGVGGADGTLQLNCSQNSHGIKLKSPPHSAGASYTLTFPNTDGNANQVLKSDGSGNLDWVDQTTDTNTQLSNAEVRTAVEAASDSNVFTDADHTKLNGIEASATADQTDAEIRAAVEAASDSNVFTDADHSKLNGIEASATADQTASEIVALVADQTIAPSEIDMEDNEKIKLGTGDDLQIYHDGSHNIINGASGQNLEIQTNAFRVNNQADSEAMITANADGAVELYYDNSKKFETTSSGIDITGSVTCDGFTSSGADVALNSGTTNANILFDASDAALEFDDSVKATFGFSDDLQIFHDGSNSYVRDLGTGNLNITGSQIVLANAAFDENMLTATQDDSVDLFYNGSKKFETSAYGVHVTGSASGNSDSHNGGTVTLDTSSSAYHYVNGNANMTFAAPINTQNGHSGSIFITQDGTGGRTGTWNSVWKFTGGTAPTLSTGANKVDRVDFVVKSSTEIHAVASLLVGG